MKCPDQVLFVRIKSFEGKNVSLEWSVRLIISLLPKKWLTLLKQQSKQSLLFQHMKRNVVPSVLFERLSCVVMKVGCCIQGLFVKKKKKKKMASVTTRLVIQQDSENCINISFNVYNLLYFRHMIYCMPNFLCTCLHMYEYDHTSLLGRTVSIG